VTCGDIIREPLFTNGKIIQKLLPLLVCWLSSIYALLPCLLVFAHCKRYHPPTVLNSQFGALYDLRWGIGTGKPGARWGLIPTGEDY
jgi:hypothetical protein